jgi:hypothetical protein
LPLLEGGLTTSGRLPRFSLIFAKLNLNGACRATSFAEAGLTESQWFDYKIIIRRLLSLYVRQTSAKSGIFVLGDHF